MVPGVLRRALSNRVFEAIELLQEALTEVLEPYWRDPLRLQSLTSYALVDGSRRVVGTSMILIGIRS